MLESISASYKSKVIFTIVVFGFLLLFFSRIIQFLLLDK